MPSTNAIHEVVLLRHGETDQHMPVGPNTPLTEVGMRQATEIAKEFDRKWLWDATIFCSTHLRCRQTLSALCENEMFRHAKVNFDPNLREVDYGPCADYMDIEYELKCKERQEVGKFYYRFKGGESPADAYVRGCLALDSIHRHAQRIGKKNVLIISHGMMIRLLVTRWMHWTPEDYNRMKNVGNCQPIHIARDGWNWKVGGIVFD